MTLLSQNWLLIRLRLWEISITVPKPAANSMGKVEDDITVLELAFFFKIISLRMIAQPKNCFVFHLQ